MELSLNEYSRLCMLNHHFKSSLSAVHEAKIFFPLIFCRGEKMTTDTRMSLILKSQFTRV